MLTCILEGGVQRVAYNCMRIRNTIVFVPWVGLSCKRYSYLEISIMLSDHNAQVIKAMKHLSFFGNNPSKISQWDGGSCLSTTPSANSGNLCRHRGYNGTTAQIWAPTCHVGLEARHHWHRQHNTVFVWTACPFVEQPSQAQFGEGSCQLMRYNNMEIRKCWKVI